MTADTQERSFLPALRFKALTPYFDAFVRVTVREQEMKRRLLDQVSLAPGDRVLDLGAGTGTLAIWVKQRWPEVEVVGLDADPEILAIARDKAAEAGEEIEFVEAFSNEMPFADASFDAVISTLFFHHIDGQTKRATFAEVARLLKPGGAFHVGDWGKPADPLQALLFLQSRTFDGFEVTRDNGRGALPEMIAAGGIGRASSHGRMRTVFGTLELLSARKAPAA